MIAINPLKITDGAFTSTVPEPDTARGEVEWVDNLNNARYDLPSITFDYTAIASSSTRDYIVEFAATKLLHTYENGSLLSSVSLTGVNNSQSDMHYLNGLLYITDLTAIRYFDTSNSTQGNIGISGGVESSTVFTSICSISSTFYLYDRPNKKIKKYTLSGSVLTYTDVFIDVDLGGVYPKITNSSDGGFAVLVADKVNLYDSEFNLISQNTIGYQGSVEVGGGISNNTNEYKVLSGVELYVREYDYDLTYKGDYEVDEQLVDVTTHRKYQCAVPTVENPVDGVLKIPPTWIDIGPTNKYAMFDDEVQTATVGTSPMVITATPGIIANGLAMFNVSGASTINVTVNSAASGEVYNKDINMNDSSNVTDAWTYYFTPIIRIDRFVLLDIPPYNDATITVTLTGAGDISAGVLAIGPQIEIGVANYNTEIQLLDFSTRERDTFGNFKTVKRAIADLVKFDVTIPKANVSYVRNQFKLLSQVPTVWVGGGGGVDDPTLVYGYYENFVNNISSPSITKSTITIQGVV